MFKAEIAEQHNQPEQLLQQFLSHPQSFIPERGHLTWGHLMHSDALMSDSGFFSFQKTLLSDFTVLFWLFPH